MKTISVLFIIVVVVISITTYFQNKFDSTVLQWMQDQITEGAKK